MFTGIIQNVAQVRSVEARGGQKAGELVMLVETGFDALELGESIAVNGVCLTVAEFSSDGLCSFHVGPESMRLTSLGQVKTNSQVNLERALRASDRLSGHWVQGHVDGLAQIAAITEEGESYRLDLDIPAELGRYLVKKGSIAVNGVSLTINQLVDDREASLAKVSIQLIPHTWKHTSFATSRAGDKVNIEVDILAKYVERLCR